MALPPRVRALGLPLVLLVTLSAAQIVHRDETVVELDGVTFALEVTASAEPGWTPTEADWLPSTEPVLVELPEHLPPGGEVEVRVAVRNTADVPAGIVVMMVDPDPQDADLFEVLEIELREDGDLLASAPAPELLLEVPGHVPAAREDHRVIDVLVRTPVSGDDRWAGARTGLLVLVEGATR